MTDPLNELRKLAEARAKATAGEWEHQQSPANPRWNRIMPLMRRDNFGFTPECEGEQLYFKNTDDCTFIAIAGSLDLQAMLSAWERDREALQSLADHPVLAWLLGMIECGLVTQSRIDSINEFLTLLPQSTLTKGDQ